MTSASRKAIEAMQALASQDLEQADDEQIRREFIEDGLDPAAEARRVAQKLDAVVAQFMRDRASAAKALRAATAHPGPRPRPTLARMKESIQAAFDKEPRLATAFRDGKRQTDLDIRSLYDDLVSMGKIRSRRK